MATGRRIAWLILGLGAVGCGLAGAVLPLVPTTPFLLLAVYAFGRSSPVLQNWLMAHPRFGPSIAAWRTHGAITRRAKHVAVGAIATSFAAMLAAGAPLSLLAVQAVVLALASVFILSRPDAPHGS
jgi:uncharacterized membrane protein YbaN (DUF454 family)